MSQTKASWLDKQGRKKTSLQWKRWSGWDKFDQCENCGKKRQEAKLYNCKLTANQWNWLGGVTQTGMNTAFTDDETEMKKWMKRDLCEICIIYLKERGPLK